ncbi:hypothetical protein DXA62_06235 [Coprobacillus sp. OF03-2AA]|uniref:hypothetical protein n=1 Tax=Faecalibacillus intestinalis TaxID=1982626 RepID=UPI000E4F2FBF|nr:hypothetical protein [Faecalibacillus intestinalis]RHP75330.1 hypothetical protein DXA62_06235 [Coprobacillus sp. OF03-2AA]
MDKIYVNVFRTYNDNGLFEFNNLDSAKRFIKRNFAKELDYLASKGEKVITSYCSDKHAEIRLADNESFALWDISAPQKLHRYMIPVIVEAETLEDALKYLQTVVKDDEIDFNEARREDEVAFSVGSKEKKEVEVKDYDKYAQNPKKTPQKDLEKPTSSFEDTKTKLEDTFITSKVKEIDKARKNLEKNLDKISEETREKADKLKQRNTGNNFDSLESRLEKRNTKKVKEDEDEFYTTFLNRK